MVQRWFNLMMRRVLQVILMLSLLGGSAVQVLSCNSLVEDRHPCCKALATIKKTTQAQLLKKTQHTSLKGGACGCAAAPSKQQEAPASSGSIQRHNGESIQLDAPAVNILFHDAFEHPVRLCAADYHSPPPFILHRALLI
jgi:hypothetical protein